jgi:hypothetical protein
MSFERRHGTGDTSRQSRLHNGTAEAAGAKYNR